MAVRGQKRLGAAMASSKVITTAPSSIGSQKSLRMVRDRPMMASQAKVRNNPVKLMVGIGWGFSGG